jgi:hypothetical protein
VGGDEDEMFQRIFLRVMEVVKASVRRRTP